MNNKEILFLNNSSSNLIDKLKTIQFKKFKNILIVGSNGLIGINLVFNLINIKKKNNYKFNLSALSRSKISKDLNNYYKINKVNYFKKNIIESNFKLSNKYDLIFFVAGYSAPKKFTDNSKETLLVHSLGLVNVSRYLKSKGNLMYLSSSEIYNGLTKNFTENFSGNINFDDVRAPYINGKKFGETYCHLLSKKGFKIKIVRVSLTYGPGAKKTDSRVINEIILKSIKNNKIKLLDNGSSIRKYIYIDDCLEIIFRM